MGVHGVGVHRGTPLHGRTRGYTEVHGRTRGYAPTHLYVTDMLHTMSSALGLSKTFFDIFAYWISSRPGGWHRSSRSEPRPACSTATCIGIFRSTTDYNCNTTGSFLIVGFWNTLHLTSINHSDHTGPPNFPTKYICIILQQSKGLCLATAKINQRADTTKCQPYFFQLIQSVLSNTSLFYKSNKEGGEEK